MSVSDEFTYLTDMMGLFCWTTDRVGPEQGKQLFIDRLINNRALDGALRKRPILKDGRGYWRECDYNLEFHYKDLGKVTSLADTLNMI